MNNYCLGEDWLLLSKTHCLVTAKQEFINGCCLARLTDWLLLSKALWLADVEQNSHTGCCLARLTAWQWHCIIYSTTTDNLSNLAAGPLDEFHLVFNIGRTSSSLPLSGWVGAVEWVLELDGVVAVALLQLTVVLHVELHQLRQRRELLPAVQVVEVPRVLLSVDGPTGSYTPLHFLLRVWEPDFLTDSTIYLT